MRTDELKGAHGAPTARRTITDKAGRINS